MSIFRQNSLIKSALFLTITGLAAHTLTACGTASSSDSGNLAGTENPPLNRGEFRRITQIASDTSSTLSNLASRIPPDLLQQARCIAVIRTVQAGFIFGGTGGDGMATCRLHDRIWSAPSYLSLGGASVGLQIGGGVVETVLLFMNDAGVGILDNPEFTLGAAIGAMVGPLSGGRGTGVSQDANIYTYSQGVGLQVRLVIDGTVIANDLNRNDKVYRQMGLRSPRDIRATQGALAPNIASPFIDTVSRVAP